MFRYTIAFIFSVCMLFGHHMYGILTLDKQKILRTCPDHKLAGLLRSKNTSDFPYLLEKAAQKFHEDAYKHRCLDFQETITWGNAAYTNVWCKLPQMPIIAWCAALVDLFLVIEKLNEGYTTTLHQDMLYIAQDTLPASQHILELKFPSMLDIYGFAWTEASNSGKKKAQNFRTITQLFNLLRHTWLSNPQHNKYEKFFLPIFSRLPFCWKRRACHCLKEIILPAHPTCDIALCASYNGWPLPYISAYEKCFWHLFMNIVCCDQIALRNSNFSTTYITHEKMSLVFV